MSERETKFDYTTYPTGEERCEGCRFFNDQPIKTFVGDRFECMKIKEFKQAWSLVAKFAHCKMWERKPEVPMGLKGPGP